MKARRIFRLFRVSLRALRRNRMRSFLTTLGIIIGVAAVIAAMSIGQGAKQSIADRFSAMGNAVLLVGPGSRNVGGVRTGFGGEDTLTVKDADDIATKCSAVEAVSPIVQAGRNQVVFGNKNWNTSVNGVGVQYPLIRNWKVEKGNFFDETMVKSAQKVCVIGASVYKQLFGESDNPIGQIIRVKKIPFTVIGVLGAKGQAGGFFDQDDLIMVPYTTAMRRITGNAKGTVNQINVSAISNERTSEAQTQIEELLRVNHRIAPGAQDDFNVRNMADIQESAQQSAQIMTILLGSIAAIALLVGGIGIMNIMLVSVTERTREIGIRMAVGARDTDILLQFLAEAVILSIIGGLLGVGLGVGASKLLSLIPAFSQMQTVVSLNSIFMSFGFAAGVGIFFGFYPARKASSLDPITALRYE